jgi:hypothetical protein
MSSPVLTWEPAHYVLATLLPGNRSTVQIVVRNSLTLAILGHQVVSCPTSPRLPSSSAALAPAGRFGRREI